MSKKCLPGVICIENTTLFILLIISIVITYHFYYYKVQNNDNTPTVIINPSSNSSDLGSIRINKDAINDPYQPPLKNTLSQHFNQNNGGVPVNMQTRGTDSNYEQVGILTRTNTPDNLILPLMGRLTMTGRDKWQYYTISNSGNLNTKLPVSLNGKSCTSEYGCDNIYNGDSVYVEGYNDSFDATIYENNPFRYIPNI
tara:strand:+ start:6387 stop:6980 length:594 start_codon:yes stop_codon:yes gene_type:complete